MKFRAPWLAKLRYFVRETMVNVARARMVNVLTIGIIAASLFILGGFVLLASNLHGAVAEWNRVAINAYLRDDAPADRVEKLRTTIAGDPVVREVRFISRRDAAALFRERFSHLAAAADDLGGDLFPASFEIVARGGREERMQATESLVATLRASPLVEEVRDNEAEARKVLALVGVVAAGGWTVGGILALASFFTIYNVIRLTVYQRRDEISILRLVGATGAFIRLPFVLEGTLQGAAGALAAEIVLFAAYGRLAAHAAATANPFLKLLTSGFLTPGQAALLALGGTLIGTAGSLISLRKFLTD
ncbi:MAG TPA: permease-like cell division protein FtsX [Verrucomicrobiae bacterium]|nr:permease-like cell division protein FtsX [Verrucomicrobiae bacterium]